MWILTEIGFFSITKPLAGDKIEDGMLQVRARVRTDLEAFCRAVDPKNRTAIQATPSRDYPFRVFATAGVVGSFLGTQAEGIQYSNFKDEVTRRQGRYRHDVYMGVWSELRRLEDDPGSPAARVFGPIAATRKSKASHGR